MDPYAQPAQQEWPKPGSLVAPYLWSLGLPLAWAFSLLGIAILAIAVRLSGAGSGYEQSDDVGLAVAVLLQTVGGIAVLATFIAMAWVKGRRLPAARLRFLGYGTIALGALTVVSVLALLLLPNGSA